MEGGCVRRLLQLCGQFDQQTTVAAAASAGLGVVGAGAALERGSGWRERHTQPEPAAWTSSCWG